MDFASYVQGISFRFLQPSRPRPHGFRALAMLLRKFGLHPEVANTRLPADERTMKRRLRQACRIPRMSTFAVGAVINRAVSQLSGEECFLNIGVWNGYTFLSGLVDNAGKRCIGVDNFSHNNSPREAFLKRFQKFRGARHTFHEMDFRDYLHTAHHNPIGFYLFDGPHTYQDQLDGLQLAEPFFADNCIVMVDDCNWEQVSAANLDFIAQSPNRYRMLLNERTPQSGHPTWWNGLMVFQLDGANSNVHSEESSGKKAA